MDKFVDEISDPDGISMEAFIDWLQTLPYEAQSATIRLPGSVESQLFKWAKYDADLNSIIISD